MFVLAGDMNAHVGKRQNSEENVGNYVKKGGTRPDGVARQKSVGGGKLLLPEDGVTQDNLQKWEQQNRDRDIDSKYISVEIMKPNRLDADSRTHLGPKNMQSNPRRQKEDEGIERRDWHENT